MKLIWTENAEIESAPGVREAAPMVALVFGSVEGLHRFRVIAANAIAGAIAGGVVLGTRFLVGVLLGGAR